MAGNPPIVDGSEVDEDEAPPFMVAHCVRHPMSFNCEASLPSCLREFVQLDIPTYGPVPSTKEPTE
jgi:hypothetical protein